MPVTLGLDIGSNSVGWALIDEAAGKMLGIGVRVFPEGVDRDTSGAEHPKNEQRRIVRGHRRQIARRARRKAAVRKALIDVGWWTGESVEAIASTDPYELRSRGLDQALTLPEFGRVLLHLSQRRGFLSNRKADRGRAKENSATLLEISALKDSIEQSGARTLGEYLHRLRLDAGTPNAIQIRNKHTLRLMFEDEFEALWTAQERFHPELRDEARALKYGRQGRQAYPREPKPLKRRREGNTILQEYGFHGLLFFQRSLYWPKSVIGRCELEPREKRCERADRLAQRFRLLNEVNNLRVIPQKGEPRPITPEERQTLLEYLSQSKEATFSQIRKKLGLLSGDGFNLEAGSRDSLHGVPVDWALKHNDLFGKGWWQRTDDERTKIVRALIDDEEHEVLRKAVESWGCTPEQAAAISDMDLSGVVRGYSSYSRLAISKLLPHLEAGLPLMTRDGTPSALGAAGYLRPDQQTIKKGRELPLPPEKINNPLVRQALFETRKVVNSVIREWGMPAAIHIELAREVQGSPERRRQASQKMRDRERERTAAADFIRDLGFKPSRDAIDRVLLWKEQGELCFYSGRPISPQQLLGGEVDIDHVLPFSRSLDNSLMNKVVAFREQNRLKGDRTVWEWVGEMDPEKFDAILQRARNLPYEIRNRKLLKLQRKNVEINEFLNRQLTDTAYITTQVLDLLHHLEGVDVVPVKGQLTYELRHMWGLDTVLRDDQLKLKNREDHRHHAVDALVIALTDRSRLQQLACVRYSDQQLSPPWSNFREIVEEAVEGIKVSHRAVRDLNGSLHNETIYGPTAKPNRKSSSERPHARDWTEDESLFVYRKKLEDLSPSMIRNIRDPRVRQLVTDRLAQFGVSLESKGPIPKNVWTEPLLMLRSTNRTSSAPSVIRKVRILENDRTIRPIRGGTACVKPDNTHHVVLFDLPGSSATRPKRELISVTMLEAAERVKERKPILQRRHPSNEDARFLFSLSRGEMVCATLRGEEGLFVFLNAAATSQEMRFKKHNDARPPKGPALYTAKRNAFQGVKVTVDPIGRIRNAND